MELQFITCEMCKEVYDDGQRKPLILECGNTFCLSCVSQKIQNNQQKFQCIKCNQDHDIAVITVLQTNKALLNLALNYVQKELKPKLVCKCSNNKEVDYYCKQDNTLCCGVCIYSHKDHLDYYFPIQQFETELQELHGILSNNIIKEADKILNAINQMINPNKQQKFIQAQQINETAENVFKLIKEIYKIQPKTQYLQHLKSLQEIDKEILKKQIDEIDQIKNQKQLKIKELDSKIIELQQLIQDLEKQKIKQKDYLKMIESWYMKMLLRQQTTKIILKQIAKQQSINHFFSEAQIIKQQQDLN